MENKNVLWVTPKMRQAFEIILALQLTEFTYANLAQLIVCSKTASTNIILTFEALKLVTIDRKSEEYLVKPNFEAMKNITLKDRPGVVQGLTQQEKEILDELVDLLEENVVAIPWQIKVAPPLAVADALKKLQQMGKIKIGKYRHDYDFCFNPRYGPWQETITLAGQNYQSLWKNLDDKDWYCLLGN